MSDESSDAFKIRRAPSGKFYVRGDDEAICLPNGKLRYFETEREAWAFLIDCDRFEIGMIAAYPSSANPSAGGREEIRVTPEIGPLFEDSP